MPNLSFADLIKQIDDLMHDTYAHPEWTSVTGNIDSIIQELRGLGFSKKTFEQYTTHELSRMMGELSVLRASLVGMKSVADRNRKTAKLLMENKRSSVYETVRMQLEKASGKKVSKADVENASSKYMSKASLIYDLHEVQYEKLQSYWYAIPEVLRSLQVRINVLHGDRDTAGFGQLAYDESVLPVDSATSQTDEAGHVPSNPSQLNTRDEGAAL